MKKIVIIMMVLSMVLCGCTSNIKEGNALLEAGKYTEAKAYFQKDIEKEKNLKDAYYGMGVACFELKEYEAAAQSFEQALTNEAEKTAVICSFLGACYMETKDYEKALDVYEKALAEQNITNELKQEIQYNLIAVYENMGNWDAAKQQLENYVKSYPNDTRVDKEADFLETR